MQKSEDKTAEQCPNCAVKKKKWTVGKIFAVCMFTVKLLTKLFDVVNKYWPKILSLFGIDIE